MHMYAHVDVTPLYCTVYISYYIYTHIDVIFVKNLLNDSTTQHLGVFRLVQYRGSGCCERSAVALRSWQWLAEKQHA